jgi:hypothetical protein
MASLSNREEFTRFEELIFSDIDGSKTGGLIESVEKYERAAKYQLRVGTIPPEFKGGLDAVQATVTILKSVWEKAHNRNFP